MQELKIGVLGISNHFLKRIILPVKKLNNIKIVAVASRTQRKAQKFAKEFDIPFFYSSYDDMLANAEIDAVYIPLPNHMHGTWIKKAADNGKHILCEKPLSMNAIEAKEVVEYAEKKGVLLMEAFMYKFHPQWQYVKDVIRTNNIGKVMYIHTSFSYNNPSATNIRNILEYGGGALMDIGCYAVSVPRFLLDKEPVKVVAQITEHANFKTDMISTALLDFGGSRATFHVSTGADAFQKVDIVATAGRICVDLPFNTYSDVSAKVSVTTGIGSKDVMFDATDQYGLMFDEFAQAILKQEKVPIPADDAILNQKVIDAIFRSSQSGNWEGVD